MHNYCTVMVRPILCAHQVLNEDVRVEGVNKCPHDCLCSHNITFDYKVSNAVASVAASLPNDTTYYM